MGKICSKIRMFSPATMAKKSQEKEIIPRKTPQSPVLSPEFLKVNYPDHSFHLAPELWNTLVSFTRDLFPRLLSWAEGFSEDMPGGALEQQLFQNLRSLLIEEGRTLAEKMQPLIDRGHLGTALSCPRCHKEMRFHEHKDAEFLTSLGWIRFSRAYYLCTNPRCHHTLCPLDAKLGTTEHRILPWVMEKTARYCAEVPFQLAVDMIGDMLGVPQSLCVRTAEELCWNAAKKLKAQQDKEVFHAFKDERGSKLPAIEGEVPEVLVFAVDGAHVPTGEKQEYHEARLGVVSRIISSRKLPASHEAEDTILGNHSYVTHIGNNEEFFEYFAMECVRRGLYKTKKLILMGDGAQWIWNRFRDHFGDLEPAIECIEILDFWHCLEHVGDLGTAIYGHGTERSSSWFAARKHELKEGHLDAFFNALKGEARKAIQEGNEELHKEIQDELDYFSEHRHRMKYAELRAKGYPIGSGTVEGGCKHVIKDRVSRSGMRWSLDGCDAILRLRALIKSNRWESFCLRQRELHQKSFDLLKDRVFRKRAA
jgi:hypothetical protein